MKQIAAMALVGMLTCSPSHAQSKPTIVRIGVESQTAPAAIEISKDGTLRPTKLALISSNPSIYGVDLADPFGNPTVKALTVPYIVAARWNAASEEIYLELRRGMSQEISADILNAVSEGKRQELEQIEKLGKKTYAEQVRRYFSARAHHRYWRFTQKNVEHQNAVRSVKEWFDASYWLASREQTYFRMDPQVVEFLNEYKALAASNREFRKTMDQIIKPGYVEGLLKEVSTTRFQMTAFVEKALKSGDLQVAMEVNEALREDLESLSREEREQVRASRRVTLDQLRKNSEYLATRASAQGL